MLPPMVLLANKVAHSHLLNLLTPYTYIPS
jgi:hypothetical protein